ncbi:MAG: FHA domain-containing protein [bacterium]|nr:FHA domain-containing protein [Myxococcales bacterium]
MATLVHPILPRRFTLGPRTLVGRANHCTFQLKNRLVSGEHALLTWADDGWRIRDLGSRNGTFVDGQPVRPGERIKLHAGNELTFADERWHLADDSPPVANARLEGAPQPRLATDDLLFLPDEDDPRVMIFADRKTGDWIAEINDEQQVVRDQERLTVGDQTWLLGLPPVAPSGEMTSTLGMDELTLSLSTLDRLRFVKNRDDSVAELTVWYRHKPIPVPVRSHHALLVALAQAILDDEEQPRVEKGWRSVDALCEALALDPAQLNTQIFRARRQFASMGVSGAARLVERRAATRQIRLGVDRVEIRTL